MLVLRQSGLCRVTNIVVNTNHVRSSESNELWDQCQANQTKQNSIVKSRFKMSIDDNNNNHENSKITNTKTNKQHKSLLVVFYKKKGKRNCNM